MLLNIYFYEKSIQNTMLNNKTINNSYYLLIIYVGNELCIKYIFIVNNLPIFHIPIMA